MNLQHQLYRLPQFCTTKQTNNSFPTGWNIISLESSLFVVQLFFCFRLILSVTHNHAQQPQYYN